MKKYIVYLIGKPMIGPIEVDTDTGPAVIDKNGKRIYKRMRDSRVVDSLDEAMQVLIEDAAKKAEKAKEAARRAEERLEKVKSYVKAVKYLL